VVHDAAFRESRRFRQMDSLIRAGNQSLHEGMELR
jgi:hypothetical protein